MDLSWYDVINNETHISQGDILFQCPIFTPEPQYHFGDLDSLQQTPLAVGLADVIVMTQACDLDISGGRTPKVDSVVVAVLINVKGQSWSSVSQVANNKINSAYLLNQNHYGVEMDWQIVNFKDLYTVPYSLLDEFRKHGARLRLKSPYLENLSQKFGNFFARVGLPNETLIAKKELEEFVKKHQPQTT
ncbi:hypothetical protein NMG90_17850 [Bacillus mycoides]|uniref:hypothetical protein n=1 Tax=Bacillus mycoides TaxID=1405 RepID=UPI000991D0AE|nr:hypothetical protein [Bacillus mycoides]MCP9227268.1 hypothetical protein [Bacillus mycoides]OOR67509.1 hypothetical protein BLW98_16100 [Bacillus mycoides]OOR67567.1 hypothetical protein BLW98_16410 [Bacillus mycoides]